MQQVKCNSSVFNNGPVEFRATMGRSSVVEIFRRSKLRWNRRMCSKALNFDIIASIWERLGKYESTMDSCVRLENPAISRGKSRLCERNTFTSDNECGLRFCRRVIIER